MATEIGNAKPAAVKSGEIIERILDVAENQDRRRYKPVQRFELIGSDGKTYSGGGMPWGVTFKERGKGYWVLESVREGTTHGKRFDSEAELQARTDSFCASRRAEFRGELVKMTEAQIAAQAAYWLKEESGVQS